MMKKYIIKSLAVIGLMFGTANASLAEGSLRYGAKVGVGADWSFMNSITKESSDNWEKGLLQIAAGGGLFAEYKFMEYVGVRGTLGFEMGGDKFTAKSEGDEKKDNKDYTKFMDFSLPIDVLVTIYLIEDLAIKIGPRVDLLLTSSISGKTDGQNITKEDIEAFKSLKNMFGIAAIVGAEYNVMSSGVLIGLDMSIGFLNKHKEKGKDDFENPFNRKSFRTEFILGYDFSNLF